MKSEACNDGVMAMRRMVIENTLRWAYREELPKSRQGVGIGGPAAVRSPGAIVDMVAETWALPDNAYGVVLDPTADEDPHPDAVAIHEAVLRLDDADVAIPADWDGHGAVDLHGGEDQVMARVLDGLTRMDGDGARILRVQPSQLVRTYAIVGLPDMIIDPPELKFEVGATGRPKWFRRSIVVTETGSYEVEIDGYDAKRKRAHVDAYRKSYLDPDPVPSLINRARVEIWRAALDLLFEALEGRLASISLMPTAYGPRPWEDDAPAAILPDLTADRWTIAPRNRTRRKGIRRYPQEERQKA